MQHLNLEKFKAELREVLIKHKISLGSNANGDIVATEPDGTDHTLSLLLDTLDADDLLEDHDK